MSGHSKWANIKRKKGIKDQEKGKLFTKITKEITIAISEGGGITDPSSNVRLRYAVDKARAAHMPKENIERAIEKSHSKESASLKEAVYEGFGPHGVGLIIVSATDNPSRTSNEIRSMLEKNGGKFGGPGTVLYNFEKCGIVEVKKSIISEEKSLELAEKLHALDIEVTDEEYIVYIPFEDLGRDEKDLSLMGEYLIEPYYRPIIKVQLQDKTQFEALIHLIDALEDLDDVSKVYANYEVDDALLV